MSETYRKAYVPCCVAAALVAVLASAGCSSGEEAYKALRERMVRTQIIARGIEDEDVIRAMMTVPRHLFVPEEHRGLAYMDSPLPIGCDQTISQPYIVALMTASLGLEGGGKVLEVGTGSGYQAAVLAEIADTVYTIEIVQPLAERARMLLDTLGYDNVFVRCGDGYDGWPEEAPFDGIIVTAAAPVVPRPLVEQLAEGGRLVIPLGDAMQVLEVLEKRGGEMNRLFTLPVRFVPMTGKVRDSRDD
jgi:protein-L-isoaspartate(D-aspartate) O-methyltransferase